MKQHRRRFLKSLGLGTAGGLLLARRRDARRSQFRLQTSRTILSGLNIICSLHTTG